jgi:ribosomal protein S18 acetylase RimI-like enzyme
MPESSEAPARSQEVRIAPLTPEETAFVDERAPLSRLKQQGTYLIAWVGEEPVGHAFVWESGESLHVGDVWVLPERRRQGLATSLMDAVDRIARVQGIGRVELTCDAENEPALRLYRKLGFTPGGERYRQVGTIMIRGQALAVDCIHVPLVRTVAPG